MAKRNTTPDAPVAPAAYVQQAPQVSIAPAVPVAPVANAIPQVPQVPAMPTAPVMQPAPAAFTSPPAPSVPVSPFQQDPAQQALNELNNATQALSPVVPAGLPVAGGIPWAGMDLSQVPDTRVRFLGDPNLTYEAEVTKTTYKTSGSGNPTLSVQLVITFPAEYEGQSLYDTIVIKDLQKPDAQPWKFKSFASSCEVLDPTRSFCIAAGPNDFNENIVQFKIQHEEYNGEMQAKVSGGYSPGKLSPGL